MRNGETIKAEPHRLRDDWFNKYAPSHLSGIDIGCQHDPINDTFRRWDQIYGDGDATFMKGVPDGIFNTVYTSHILEHIENYQAAIKNWWRILAPGGNLIILVPHRDLYEKKAQPPSIWNLDHKWFWLPDRDEPPRCLNFKRVLQEALPTAEFIVFDILKTGWAEVGPKIHSPGEYSIEAILKKPVVTSSS